MNKLADFILKYPKRIIVFFIVLTLGFGLLLPGIKVDPDVQNMLPPDLPSLVMLKKIEQVFGGTELALLLLEAPDVLEKPVLDRLRTMAEKARKIEGIASVIVLPEAERDEFEDEPENEAAKNEAKTALRERIKGNDMTYGALVARDFTAAAVIIKLAAGANGYTITQEIRKITDEVKGPGTVAFGGLPFIREQISNDIPRDMMVFMPISLLIMLLFLLFCFRQFRGVILPFAVVLMSVVVGMGLVPLFGWKMMTITILLPILMIAISNNYGVYFISQYQQEYLNGTAPARDEVVRRLIHTLAKPIVADAITTMFGMLCLVTHTIIPAAQLGILTAIGIFFALAASLLFIPAWLAILPQEKPHKLIAKHESHIMNDITNLLASVVARNPRGILIFSLIIALVAGYGIKNIIVDSNVVNYYPKDSEIARVSNIINTKFGGAQTVTIVAEGDIRDPQIIKKIDDLEQDLKKIPEIGNSTSIAKLLRLMTKATLKPEDPGFGQVPTARNTIDFYLEQYDKMANPEDLRALVDSSFRHALITVQITDEGSEAIKRVVTQIREKIKDEPLFTKIGGTGVIFEELINKVVSGQVQSLLLALVIIAVIVMLLFRSFAAGLVASIPLVLSMILLFGTMGYFGITLDIATAMLSSIVLGMGVDYTINFMWRYREERKIMNHSDAVLETLKQTGRGILFNGLAVVIGFFVLIFSVFIPIKFFGYLIILSIITCMLGALAVLPSLLVIFKPKFLEPK